MPSWNWTEESNSLGTRHQSVTNTDYSDTTLLKKGYDYINFSEVSPSPISCWPLHEDSGSTAYDVAGSNDMSYNNGAGPSGTGTVAGPVGTTAAVFDGSDDSADTSTIISPSTFTYTCWFNPDVVPTSNYDVLMSCLETGGPTGHTLHIDGNTQSISTNIADGSSTTLVPVDNAVSVSTGTWHFASVTYDGSEAVTYLDGEEVGRLSTGYAESQTLTFLGQSPKYAGALNDCRVYNTALAQSEIKTLRDVVIERGTWFSNEKQRNG